MKKVFVLLLGLLTLTSISCSATNLTYDDEQIQSDFDVGDTTTTVEVVLTINDSFDYYPSVVDEEPINKNISYTFLNNFQESNIVYTIDLNSTNLGSWKKTVTNYNKYLKQNVNSYMYYNKICDPYYRSTYKIMT